MNNNNNKINRRIISTSETWILEHFNMQYIDIIETGSLISRGRYADYAKQRCLSAVLDHINYWQ
jgi:hypothetical protein